MRDREESPWSRARCGGLATSDPKRYDKIFFDQKGRPPINPPYMKFCGPCPIRGFCLAYAVVHKEEGVWGGTTTAERENLPSEVKKELKEEAARQGWLESRPSVDDLIRQYRKSQEELFEEPLAVVVEMQRQEFRFEFEAQTVEGSLALQNSAVLVQQVQVTVERTVTTFLPPLEELLGEPPHPTVLRETYVDSKEFLFPFEVL